MQTLVKEAVCVVPPLSLLSLYHVLLLLRISSLGSDLQHILRARLTPTEAWLEYRRRVSVHSTPPPKDDQDCFRLYVTIGKVAVSRLDDVNDFSQLTSNRNEYQKQRNYVSGEQSGCRRVRMATLPPSVRRLSRQCGILNLSQP
jgi:hypothetical protein